jgi:hypothetical protein
VVVFSISFLVMLAGLLVYLARFLIFTVLYMSRRQNLTLGTCSHICIYACIRGTRNSISGIMCMLVDGRFGVRIPTGARDSSPPRRLWHSPSHPFTEYQGYFLAIKRLGREIDLFPSSDEVRDK